MHYKVSYCFSTIGVTNVVIVLPLNGACVTVTLGVALGEVCFIQYYLPKDGIMFVTNTK